DLAPTVLDVAGVTYPASYRGHDVLPQEGRSLLPTFRGKQRQLHEAIFWEHSGNHAVRTGDWKLVSKFQEQWELYKLAEDRTEMKDLGASNPGRVSEMRAQYEAWAKRCNVVPWDQVRKRSKSDAG